MEGDFVPGVATVKAKAGTDFSEFAFPSINGSPPAAVIGGDTIVAFKDTPAIQAFVKFLATSDAAKAWASRGGFATGNTNMPVERLPRRGHTEDGRGDREGEERRVRHVRPAAERVRRHGRPG